MRGHRPNGQFAKGHVPANNGQRGTHLCGGPANRGRFRPGHRSNVEAPIGSARLDARTGEVVVKVPEPNPYLSHRGVGLGGHYKRRAVVVWEREVGPVPEGYVVKRLLDDPEDDRIENLCTVPRRVLANINCGHWHPDKLRWRDVPNTLDAREAAVAVACLKARVHQLEEARR